MKNNSLSGGCQCGAIRFSTQKLGRASICHCRMCQKAFGGFYAALVSADEYSWTRGKPTWFRSSNQVERGFCEKCGTPLAYKFDGGIELAIASFDKPELLPPEIQICTKHRVEYVDELAKIEAFEYGADKKVDAIFNNVHSYQHPDHDTEEWPPK